jgi:NADH:ubiquinone oxidoreductase subunit C
LAEEVINKLRETIGAENVLEVKYPMARRIFVLVKPETFKQAISYLVNELNFKHLTTITGVDLGEEFEVIYHLNDENNELSLKVRTPRSNPVVPTITDVVPGAVLYEREIHDMFGIIPEGHPNLKKVMLPDDWPEGVYPLRKDWTIEKIRAKLDGKEAD